MTLPIIGADQRMSERRGVKGVLIGKSGIGGPTPALRDDQAYSQAHYDAACARYGDPAQLDRYHTLFVDSITVAGRLCLQWSKGQPQAYSDKTGKPDMRGAYGIMGQEMIAWITHLQHTRGKSVWFIGILKCERIHRKTYPTLDAARADVFEYIERFHNQGMRRRVARQDRKFSALSQPSVVSG